MQQLQKALNADGIRPIGKTGWLYIRGVLYGTPGGSASYDLTVSPRNGGFSLFKLGGFVAAEQACRRDTPPPCHQTGP